MLSLGEYFAHCSIRPKRRHPANQASFKIAEDGKAVFVVRYEIAFARQFSQPLVLDDAGLVGAEGQPDANNRNQVAEQLRPFLAQLALSASMAGLSFGTGIEVSEKLLQ
jgi:ABC-type polar amino acid transport system ATPase subunit